MSLADTFAGTSWQARIQRLHFGIEPVDALSRSALPDDVDLRHEHVQLPAPLPSPPPTDPSLRPRAPFGDIDQAAGLPGISRNPSGRFGLSFGQRGFEQLDVVPTITLRLTSPGRRYVPRRLSIPFPLLPAVEADERIARSCRPVLFPGAAYGVRAGETVIRGRALWHAGAAPPSEPVRWARVVARTHEPVEIHHEDGTVTLDRPELGRARGDDTGEFLLVLGALPLELAATPSADLAVEVVVTGRTSFPVAFPSPTGSTGDPLWDLPVEELPDLDPDGLVLLGRDERADHTASATRVETCRRGRAHRPTHPFVVVP